MRRTRVLVVDDSALMREVLTEILAREPSIEVVGTAPDPVIAWNKIKSLAPDVLTLDIEMPRMDGLTFLEKLMTYHPVPVVMISSLTEKNSETALRALEIGAVDLVGKPTISIRDGVEELAQDIVDKVKAAGRARLRRLSPTPPPLVERSPRPAKAPPPLAEGTSWARQVLAVGASTGGTDALATFVAALPPDAPGVLVVQHMPEKFTRSFASRLDRSSEVRVKEAEHGDPVLPGHALIAPGNHHIRVVRAGTQHSVQIDQAPRVNRHRPSVDVLFESCAQIFGPRAVGVVMTGMGEDGARGLRAMHDAGAWTIVQDEETCVVFGMPNAAIRLGAADEILPLTRIAAAALRAASRLEARP